MVNDSSVTSSTTFKASVSLVKAIFNASFSILWKINQHDVYFELQLSVDNIRLLPLKNNTEIYQ